MKVLVFDAKKYDQQFMVNTDDITFVFVENKLDENTVHIAQGYDAICIFVHDNANSNVIKQLQKYNVKLIALRCAGFNNVDIEAAKSNDIKVIRVPGYSPYAIAEHAFALLLTLNRKIHRANNRIHDQNFSLQGLMGFDLNEKVVGVIGTGKIGQVFCKIANGFGMKILAYDPFPKPQLVNDYDVQYVDFDYLLKNSDVVSLHSPLLDSTYHILNSQAFEKMKKGTVLINTSRGGLIDTDALIYALKSGIIGGAGLDVYEEEDKYFFEDHSDEVLNDDNLARLLSFNNVLITSHQGFFTEEAVLNITNTTIEGINEFRLGHPLTNEVSI